MNTNELDPRAWRALRETFVDLLLEERFADGERRVAAPEVMVPEPVVPEPIAPEPSAVTEPRRRQPAIVAAALLLCGVGLVVLAAVQSRSGRAVAAGDTTEQQQQQEQDPDRRDRGVATDARAWLPLVPGTRWTYRETRDRATTTVVVEATAAVDVDGTRVVQLSEVTDAGDVSFSFWSADERGVFQVGHGGTSHDPRLVPVAGLRSALLPSPVGGPAEWTFRRLPPRARPVLGAVFGGGGGGGGGGVGPIVHRAAEEALEFRVQVVDVAAAVARLAGDAAAGEWRALHLRLRGEESVENVYLARGVGIVRTERTAQGETVVRELLGFERGATAERGAALAAAAGADAAARATWLEKPAAESAAWTQRSEFAAVPAAAGGMQAWRVFGDRAVPFDPAKLEDWVAMASDEGWTHRMHGLCPQRTAEGLAWLHGRVHQVVTGQAVDEQAGFKVQVRDGGAVDLQREVVVAAPGGEPKPGRIHVVMANGTPTEVALTTR